MTEPPEPAPLSDDLEREIEAAMLLAPDLAAERISALEAAHPDAAEEIAGLALLLGLDGGRSEPETIGGYRIVCVLGTGGMGKVYLAEQDEPVRRQVALKVILGGFDTEVMMARFAAERQALAMMDHDAIAKVYDAGTTAAGQPYIAMEYVAGVSLHEFCQRHRLSIDERIRILQAICDGVQHAHHKGVIHRDLKPSNILVAGTRERPRIKIIDFGLVRDVEVAEGPLRTLHGQLLGTPEFMSPEQSLGDARRIDTRTDVYALGAILYYLLTGELPLALDDDETKTPYERLRQLHDAEPRRPSSRVSDIARAVRAGDDVARTANERLLTCGLDASKLSRRLRGDLDWIVMKALERDPERRYPTAAALASDLGRLLAHEPVVARPPSAGYRLQKLVRRYRMQFVAAALVLLTSLAGAIVAIDFAVQAHAQERLAEHNATQATTNLQRWTRLADRRRLETLIREADELWPAIPAEIPALRDWLRRARALTARLPQHREALAAVRKLGVREREALAKDARSKKAERVRIAEIDHEFEFLSDDPDPRAEPHRQKLQTERAALAEAVAERRVWLFADEETSFRHRQLQDLVADLTRFREPNDDLDVVTVPDVEARLAAAVALRESSEDPAFVVAWAALQADVARPDSRYHGLSFAPIPGIVPLGIDRHSGLWELYHVASGSKPEWQGEPLGRGEVHLDPRSGAEAIVLVLLPVGTFHMGARKAHSPEEDQRPNCDLAAVSWEAPVQEVSLAPFLIGKYEVTQGQWQRLLGRNPSYHKAGDRRGDQVITPRHPVEMIAWDDCYRACRRWDLAMPTEAQWEYACRAGTGSSFYTGEDAHSLEGHANLSDERSARLMPGMFQASSGFVDNDVVHAPVGSYAANPFGLYDVHGNVQEWVQEQMLGYAMWPARAGDGHRGLWFGKPRDKAIVRGGSYIENADFCRCASRVVSDPDASCSNAGLRVARPLTR